MTVLRSPHFARIAPFATYIAILALEGQAELLPGGFDVRLLYPLKILLVVAMLAVFWRTYDELRNVRFASSDAVLSIAAGVAVFVVWIGLDASWALLGEPGAGYDPRNGGEIDWGLAAMRLAGAALVVPVMEELFWRSFVMRWLERSDFLSVLPGAVGWRAILISSVVFGFEHQQWLAGILAGVTYAWLYRRTGHLFYPMLAHAVTNGVLGAWVLATGQWSYW